VEWREPLRLLVGNRRFAALWGSDLVATIGDRVHRVALAALVYELTGSMTVAGLAFLASGLPDLLLGPLAGVVVDRVDRRRVMIASDLARVLPVVLLPIAAEYWIGSLYCSCSRSMLPRSCTGQPRWPPFQRSCHRASSRRRTLCRRLPRASVTSADIRWPGWSSVGSCR